MSAKALDAASSSFTERRNATPRSSCTMNSQPVFSFVSCVRQENPRYQKVLQDFLENDVEVSPVSVWNSNE